MNSLRKKLFFIIGGMIGIAMLVILGYSMYSIRLDEKIVSQSHWYDLQVSMRFMEAFMEDIENMLLSDTKEDENMEKIIRGGEGIDWHMALIKKKREFGKEIKKYQFLDGMFLYDSKSSAFVSQVGDYVTFDMYSSVKENMDYITQYFEKGNIKNEWTAMELEEQYYLVRMIKVKTVYICAWMKPEHLLQGIEDQGKSHTYFLLCDGRAHVLTPLEGLGGIRIEGEQVFVDQERYRVYGYDSARQNLSLKVLVKENHRQEVFWYAAFPILGIVCMGIMILLLVWRLVRGVVFEPIDHMMLKKTLEQNKATLQFLQLQIKPHFLNNCLSLIRNLILFEQYEEAENAVLVLSDYTRASLRPDILVTVEREAEQVRSWYELQKLRLKNRIHVDIWLEDGVGKKQIPTMLLHTFAENAAKHFGREDGIIEIEIRAGFRTTDEPEKGMEITIKDNGAGFPEDVLLKLREGKEIVDRNGIKHIGITSIMKRLDILYEGAASIEIRNRDTGGSEVRICLLSQPVNPAPGSDTVSEPVRS